MSPNDESTNSDANISDEEKRFAPPELKAEKKPEIENTDKTSKETTPKKADQKDETSEEKAPESKTTETASEQAASSTEKEKTSPAQEEKPSAELDSQETAIQKETNKKPQGSIPNKKSKLSAIVLDILILVLVVGAGFVGWKYYEQNKALPPSLLERTKLDYENILEQYQKTQLDLINAEKRRIHIDSLIKQTDRLMDMRKALELKRETLAQKEKEIADKRAEMRAYFLRFRNAARKNGRSLEFESLILPKTKQTFLEVVVQRVLPNGISIVHAGGATMIPAQDLPEELQTRWAYTDPLGIADMEVEAAADNKLKEKLGRNLPKLKSIPGEELDNDTQPTPANLATPKAIETKSYDPPSKAPSVTTGTTPSKTNTEEPSNLDDKWTPPVPPLPLEN